MLPEKGDKQAASQTCEGSGEQKLKNEHQDGI